MSQEVIYTSAPQGLRPGSFGFCTVAATPGMASSLAERLESLSGYRHLFPPGDPQAALNPVVHSHLIVKVGGRRLHILSRIADAGLDYSQRSNKLAHHVALDTSELPLAPPAWVAAQPGFLETQWTGTARLLRQGRIAPAGNPPPQICQRWREATGDPGWAGVLAQHALDGRRPAYLIVPRGFDPLPLLVESQLLLPERKRWEVTFSTYYTQLPAGVDCLWRCVVEGTSEAQSARGLRGDVVIDVTRTLGAPPAGQFVDAARTGVVPLEVVPERPAAPVHLPASSPRTQPAMQHLPPLPQPDDLDYQLGPPPVGPQRASPPVVQPATSPPQRTARTRGRAWKIAAVIAAQILLLTFVGGGGFWAGLEMGRHQTSSVAQSSSSRLSSGPNSSTDKSVSHRDVRSRPAIQEAVQTANEPRAQADQNEGQPTHNGSDGRSHPRRDNVTADADAADIPPRGRHSNETPVEPASVGDAEPTPTEPTESANAHPDNRTDEANAEPPKVDTDAASSKDVILPIEPVQYPGRLIPNEESHLAWKLPKDYPSDRLEIELLGNVSVRASTENPLTVRFAPVMPSSAEPTETVGILLADELELARLWRDGDRLRLRWTQVARDHETDLKNASSQLLFVVKNQPLSFLALERFDLQLGKKSFSDNLRFVISSTKQLSFSPGSPFFEGRIRIRNMRGKIETLKKGLEVAAATDVAPTKGIKHEEVSIEDGHLAYRIIVSQPDSQRLIFRAEGYLEAADAVPALQVVEEARFHDLARNHRDLEKVRQEKEAAKKAGRPIGKLNIHEGLLKKNILERENALKAKSITPATLTAVSDACNAASASRISFDLHWEFRCKYGVGEIFLTHVEPTYSRHK